MTHFDQIANLPKEVWAGGLIKQTLHCNFAVSPFRIRDFVHGAETAFADTVTPE
jgi:hypothetical protein